MDRNLEFHKQCLDLHCRICHSTFAERKNKSQFTAHLKRTIYSVNGSYKGIVPYKNLLRELYNIDIDQDNEYIHPTSFCSSCFSNLDNHLKDETFDSIPETCMLEWKPHDVNCDTCKKHTKGKAGGRPPKRKRGLAKHKDNVAKQACRDPESAGPSRDARNQAAEVFCSRTSASKESSCDKPDLEVCGIDPEDIVVDTIQPQCICTLCSNVIFKPIQVQCCLEIFCQDCLSKWFQVCSVCPQCRDYCDHTHTKTPHPDLVSDLYELQYHCPTCDSTVYYQNIYIHFPKCSNVHVPEQEQEPETSAKPKRGRPPGPSYDKGSLLGLVHKSSKRKRSSPVRKGLKHLVQLHKEDYGDVVKYLLVDYFEFTGRYREARELVRFFDRKTFGLSTRKCLALRVSCFQSKNQYQRRRKTVNAGLDQDVYQPLDHLNAEEKTLLPGAASFTIESSPNSIYNFDSVAVSGTEPIDILAGFKSSNPVGPTHNYSSGLILPQMAGFRWRYDQAIAQTLFEYNDVVEDGMKAKNLNPSDPKQLLYCRFKDGSDGLGEMPVKVSKEVLPNKSVRYAFVLTHVWTFDPDDGHKIIIFDETEPNSEFWTRPLLVALCDENDTTAVGICIRPIEAEKQALNGAKITINGENGNTHTYIIKIESTMLDEKLERVVKNLESSGSNYNCTLCEYNKSTDLEVTGPVPITRNTQFTKAISRELQHNASDGHFRNEKDMKLYGKGVKDGVPFMEASDILDSTHATINTAELIEHIFDHEISEETKEWNQSKCDAKKLGEAKERRLNTLKGELGRNRDLMMKGNLGRVLYSVQCENLLVPLIPKEDRQTAMRIFLQYMRKLRTVWVATHPDTSAEAVADYNSTAEELGTHLRDNFPYIKHWTNYLHKIIAHGGELLEKYGTIGGDASEGNECQNKVFRYVHKNLSRNNAKLDIRDCLIFSWLYTSRLLRRELATSVQYTCSGCGKPGHNVRTCDELE